MQGLQGLSSVYGDFCSGFTGLQGFWVYMLLTGYAGFGVYRVSRLVLFSVASLFFFLSF